MTESPLAKNHYSLYIPVDYIRQPGECACVPAVVAMLLRHSGRDATPASVIAGLKKFDPEIGTYTEDIEEFFIRWRIPSSFTSGLLLQDVVRVLEQRIPVGAVIANFEDEYPHIVLLTGYEGKELLLNDPYNEEKKRVPFDEFQRRWKLMENLTLYLPPQK